VKARAPGRRRRGRGGPTTSRGHRARAGAAGAVAALLLVTAARRVSAQAPDSLRLWTGTAEANASVFFGNSEQRVFGGHVNAARADSALELSGDVQGLYGDAVVGDDPRQVIKRLWLLTATADYRPLARTSPFVFGTFESNYEKRIARRYSGGVGAKQTFVRTEQTEVSLSLALVAERTVPRDSSVGLPTERLRRWSLRGRARRALDDRLRASHVTFWRPSVRRASDFLILSTTELEYGVTSSINLTLTFLDNYDSEAVRRGARTYNDGQLLFGLGASW
jgi:hypothetical protein